ncbi:uncharacterized protein LOC114660678 isoform X1 [Erpetoichthys calabaricus]|uniref:uncharacterized protein LOC114660678 isoform X1 n=1 Tax=Erpetoichthys calabaricus TaxID=27687 RepID=UPI0022347B95|nr:uncharacterized protein LOC114660678 isoform X1 [Erpetoichthys calabaricus]
MSFWSGGFRHVAQGGEPAMVTLLFCCAFVHHCCVCCYFGNRQYSDPMEKLEDLMMRLPSDYLFPIFIIRQANVQQSVLDLAMIKNALTHLQQKSKNELQKKTSEVLESISMENMNCYEHLCPHSRDEEHWNISTIIEKYRLVLKTTNLSAAACTEYTSQETVPPIGTEVSTYGMDIVSPGFAKIPQGQNASSFEKATEDYNHLKMQRDILLAYSALFTLLAILAPIVAIKCSRNRLRNSGFPTQAEQLPLNKANP